MPDDAAAPSGPRSGWPLAVVRIYAALLMTVAIPMAAGGGYLVSLGGSPYYLASGLVLAVAAVLLWRARRAGAALYALFLLATLAWAVWACGFDGWGLAGRLAAPVVFGLPLAAAGFRRRLA